MTETLPPLPPLPPIPKPITLPTITMQDVSKTLVKVHNMFLEHHLDEALGHNPADMGYKTISKIAKGKLKSIEVAIDITNGINEGDSIGKIIIVTSVGLGVDLVPVSRIFGFALVNLLNI